MAFLKRDHFWRPGPETINSPTSPWDVGKGCLLRAGEEIKLRRKVYETLRYLVEHPGRRISKQELMQAKACFQDYLEVIVGRARFSSTISERSCTRSRTTSWPSGDGSKSLTLKSEGKLVNCRSAPVSMPFLRRWRRDLHPPRVSPNCPDRLLCMPCSIPRWTGSGARVGYFPVHTAFPVS